MPEDKKELIILILKIWNSKIMQVAKETQGKTTLKTSKVSHHKSNNAMNMGRKQFHATIYEHKIEAHESQRCHIQENGKMCHAEGIIL